MKDKNAERHSAANKSEICFVGTDGAGHSSTKRQRNITYPDIREESALVCPQTAASARCADGKSEMLRCGRAGSRAASRDGKMRDMSESSLYPQGTVHSSYGNVRTVHGVSPASQPCGSVHVPHRYDSARRSNTAPRQGGSRRGICARIAAPICAAVCALSLIHFSFSPGDIRRTGKFSSDYIPAAITFTPPEKLEPKGFWDYFSEAMAEFFGLYER